MKVMYNENLSEAPLTPHIKKVHFIGIGGIGMSGIAEILIAQGYDISGSDISMNKNIKFMEDLGATIYIGHHEQNIKSPDLVVISSAIDSDNPELLAAQSANIPVIPRARMLAELMANKNSVAVAGTHGKTTTTGLITSVFLESGLEPTFVIGGILHSQGTNAKLGNGDYFVAEADESDASFLYLNPKIAVVTNIDADHLWFYENDFEKLKQVFINFLNRLPQDGYGVICIDDPVVRELLPYVKSKYITYGFSADANWQMSDFQQYGLQGQFQIHDTATSQIYRFNLNMAGEHNALNAACAIIIALQEGIPEITIKKALAEYQGTGRRCQIRGEYDFGRGKALIIDDYGHHPREIEATIKAIKTAWPEKRLVLAFQPQRYSRTQTLFEDFAKVLGQVQHLLLLEIYAAGEKPVAGIDSMTLGDLIKKYSNVDFNYLPRDKKIEEFLSSYLLDGDILLMQGAGDIGAMAARLAP